MKNVTFGALLIQAANPNLGAEEARILANNVIVVCCDDPEAKLSINIYDPAGVLAEEEGE